MADFSGKMGEDSASSVWNLTEWNSSLVLQTLPPIPPTRYTIVGHHEPALKIALEVLLVALLAFVMLAMGADITWKDVWKHLRRPVGVAIGMASQFAVLPFCAFILTYILSLNDYQSMSLLIVSCCPGGVASNLFTMWCNGSVSLSICMTTMSTCMALGMMPLNLLMYTSGWAGDSISVPYVKLATTLVTILIPVLVGIFIRTYFPKAAVWVLRMGTTAGFLSIIATIIIQSLLIPGLFDCGWQTYVASILLPLLGFTFGYIIAYFCKMSHRECRTVAMETGSQNLPLALTIILLSFPFEAQKQMAPFPMLFAIFVHVEAISGALVYHWRVRVAGRRKAEKIGHITIEDSKTNSAKVTEMNILEATIVDDIDFNKNTKLSSTEPKDCSEEAKSMLHDQV